MNEAGIELRTSWPRADSANRYTTSLPPRPICFKKAKTYTHGSAHERSGGEHRNANVEGGVNQEHAHGANVGSHEGTVDGVAAGKKDRGRVEKSLELAIGHDGAAEGHATDVGTEEEGDLLGSGGRVFSEVREVVDVGGDAGEDRGDADERVEGGDQLRQVGDFDSLGDGRSDGSTTWWQKK